MGWASLIVFPCLFTTPFDLLSNNNNAIMLLPFVGKQGRKMYGAAKPVAGGSFFDGNVPQVVLKSLFSKYDKDGSGQLNRLELQGLFMDDLCLSKEQAESYAYLLDKDGNGKISFEEFNAWLHSGEKFKNVNDKSRYHRLKKAVELFKSYDKDGSGSLDKDEFEKLFLAYGGKKSNVSAGLKELDKDGNGVISFEEMMRWLRWIPIDD